MLAAGSVVTNTYTAQNQPHNHKAMNVRAG
jgi:hypothetical protein